jgi:hypothetical protein
MSSNKKISKANHNQFLNPTIRVQIDFPIDQIQNNNNKNHLHTPNSICLQINLNNQNSSLAKTINTSVTTTTSTTPRTFSTRNVVKNNDNGEVKLRAASSDNLNDLSMCSLTSGYSTSSLLSTASSNASSRGNNAYLKNNQAFLANNTKIDRNLSPSLNYANNVVLGGCSNEDETENLYDKLSHSSHHNQKRRYSISSDEENNTIYSNVTSTASNYMRIKPQSYPTKKESDNHIYEDITNFKMGKQVAKSNIKDSSIYENMSEMCTTTAKSSSIKRFTSKNRSINLNESYVNESNEHSSKKYIYKREYTVNEIFQNVKKFKEQAIKQESSLNSSISSDKKPAAAQTLVNQFLNNQQIRPSVNIIKQMFELRDNAMKNSIESSVRTRRMMMKQRKQIDQHIYENDPILNPIDV